jgi:hypothetical protein
MSISAVGFRIMALPESPAVKDALAVMVLIPRVITAPEAVQALLI